MCLNTNPFLFIYVFNRAADKLKRNMIRNTWGDKQLFPNIKLVFILGFSENHLVNREIEYEFDTYGDIIQGTFVV